MPAYNAGNYIAEAINSIIDQSYENWELIIVNDGSTDKTAATVENIIDKRIVIENQENKGQCNAANRAFYLSRGNLIKFMDADDIISSNFIENQVKTLKGEANAIATASWGRFYNNEINTFKLVKYEVANNTTAIEWLMESMHKKEVMLQCALWLIPRQILAKSGLWDEELSLINDFEFFIRVLLCAQLVIFTDDAILYYRSNVLNSLSGLKSRKAAESAYNSMVKGIDHILTYENSERTRTTAAYYLQNFVYTFYPRYIDLICGAERKIKELGGTDVTFPAGGYTKIIVAVLGWKLAKKIKLFLNKYLTKFN